jgi:CheY-like chemotaxis protein
LSETDLDAEQLDYVNTIRGSGDTLFNIVSQILDFSKIESENFELEEHSINLPQCVEESISLVAPKAAGKGLDLTLLIDGRIPQNVLGDSTRLRQVLVNLLDNAVKFTEKGGIAASLKSRQLDENSHEIQFAVRDSGIGIPEDRIDRLFKSFSQVDASMTRRFGGTGLGLAICKRLVEAMRGRIWVESEPGQGTTFHFTIQVGDDSKQPLSFFGGEQTHLIGKRPLLVSDNAAILHTLSTHLQEWGMLEPETAVSPIQALKQLQDKKDITLIILDSSISPTQSKCYKFRQIQQELPIILLTPFNQQPEQNALPNVSYIRKPIKPTQLLKTVTQSINFLKPAAQPQASKSQLNGLMAAEKPLRILMAEDNLINQKVAQRILAKLGYKADVAGNGLEAVEALKRQPYDLVLMDIQMPEMDGLEATKQIRQTLSATQQPRIVALTANALVGDREHYLANGMDDYISKPVRIESLVEILDRAFNQQTATA